MGSMIASNTTALEMKVDVTESCTERLNFSNALPGLLSHGQLSQWVSDVSAPTEQLRKMRTAH